MADFGSDSFDGSSRIDIVVGENGSSGVLRKAHLIASSLQRLDPGVAASLRGEALRLGENMQAVVKGAASVALQTAIQVSPVDTGLFRGNWQVKRGLGKFRAHPTPETDKEGISTLEEGLSEINDEKALEPGEQFWIVNAAAHARALEEGWSKQAPAGVTHLVVQATEAWVSRQRILKRGKL